MSEFLTTKEVADLLRLKERKVYDLAARNMIPCVKATGKLLFPKTEINQWIQHKGASLAETAPRPLVILGSHDPLFEWTVTASGCGLPTFLNGSLDGFMRFKNREGIACGIHTQNPDLNDWNTALVETYLKQSPSILVHWAKRERGLVTKERSDISNIEEAIDKILDTIVEESEVAIIVESTVYPGVTRKITSQAASKKGLTIGRDFHMAYCPERVNPGDSEHDVKSVARVIGCDKPEIGKRIIEMYSAITDAECSYVGSLEVAEAAKMVENVQRDIDIAFTNELARILPEMGLDVEEVLEAASTKWNFHRHHPGIGVGGHCIPVDPYYYIEIAKSLGEDPSMAIAARSTNSSMPIFSGDMIIDITSKNGLDSPTILILGYSYKPDVGDNRETPVAPMRERLIELGAKVIIWDPFFSESDLSEIPGSIRNLSELNIVDAVVIGTAHSEILNLDWDGLLKNCTNSILFDGRRFLDSAKLEDEGWKYFAIGRPY